jgi:hypothetical protein
VSSEPKTHRRGLLALLLGGMTAALTITAKPAEAQPDEASDAALDGGTP